MTTRHITIGPEFFAKARNDYNEWHWAIIREFMQNSIDAKAKNITLTIEPSNGEHDTTLTITNDGKSMSEEILTEKLLSLGSSGKEDRSEGTIGGFGKAKEILYFCHKRYMIETGDMLVQGSGASYTLEHDHATLRGTRSTVVIEGQHWDELEHMAKRFANMAQWNGTFTVNGVKRECKLHKGSRRKETSFGVIYTNRSYENRLIVRIGGVPMFHDYISYEGCVLVELSKDSLTSLTSNRDSLKGNDRDNLMSFISELAADKDSAFRDTTPTYHHFPGERFSVRPTLKKKKGKKVEVGPVSAGVDSGEGYAPAESIPAPSDNYATAAKMSAAAAAAEESTETLGFEFIVKNETDMKVPTYYMPGNMGSYAEKILSMWTNVLVKMHEILGVRDDYSVGFIFSEDSEAQHENGSYGRVYYLNPATLVTQDRTASRSFSKRFRISERDRIIMIALHEVIHGMGYSWHDERYANKLTELAATVMKNRKKFNACF